MEQINKLLASKLNLAVDPANTTKLPIKVSTSHSMFQAEPKRKPDISKMAKMAMDDTEWGL